MANTLKLAKTASSALDLLGSEYEFVEADQPSPTYERQTRAACGTNGSKVTKRTLVSWSIPLTIFCLGSDGNTRFDVRDSLLAELEKAVLYEMVATDNDLYDGLPRFLIRTVDNQSPIDIWQVLDYNVSFGRRRDDNKYVTTVVELICWPGQKIPEGIDLTGLTVTSMLGGIGRYILGADSFPVAIGAL